MNLKPFVSQTKLPSSGDAISGHNGRPEIIVQFIKQKSNRFSVLFFKNSLAPNRILWCYKIVSKKNRSFYVQFLL